jgi:glucosamine-6-phosphate deaminase
MAGKGFNYQLSEFLAYRDEKVCSRVRKIKKEQLTKHKNKDFKISIVEGFDNMMLDYALDVATTIKRFGEEGRKLVILLPASVSRYAAPIINAMGISCKHVHTFNMDEYADEEGNSAPADWPWSFQKLVWDTFWGRIEERLRPEESQIHFPSTKNISDYAKMIEDEGGIDVCFSQVGWNGHIAYFEPEEGRQFGEDIEAFKQAGPRVVTISPVTVMQNSLMFNRSGDWSWHPPKAVTVGPAQFVQARRHSWRQWGYLGGGVSWQRFIVRLVCHGPVTPLVPGSILQTLKAEFKILEDVAENCSEPA